MLEKKLVPQLRFSEFDGVWNTTKISEVFTLFNGYAFSSSNALKSDGVLWVKIADVGIDNMKTDSLSYLPKEYVSTYKKFVLKEGDYVVALTRPILSGNLKIARINSYFDNSLLNQRVAKLLTNNNPTFVFNLLKRDKLIKSIENNIAGSDPPNLSPKDINHIIIKIPSIKEQQKIASFLTEVDTKLSQLTKKKALLENYKKGVMQQIFSQHLRFKDDDGNDYGDWEEKKLGSLSSLITKGTTPTSLGFTYLKEGVNFIKVECITKRGFIDIGFTPKVSEECNTALKRSALKVSDILFSIAGTLGRTAIVKEKDLPANTNQALSIIRLKRGVNLNFINHSLNTASIEKYIFKMVSVGAQPNLNLQQVGNIKIKIPCLKEQNKIANFLSDLDAKIEVLSTSIENTQYFKKGLLQQLFV
jgi:type I restriction enzyme S subunit